MFRASLTALEACNLTAPVAQAIFKKQNWWRGRRCDRRAAHADPGGFCTSARVGIGATESAGGRWLSGSQKKVYELLNVEELRPIDDIVETSGLNSSAVLATLFDLEMKGMVRQIPWKAVQQSAVVNAGVSAPQAEECTQSEMESISCKRKSAADRRYIR